MILAAGVDYLYERLHFSLNTGGYGRMSLLLHHVTMELFVVGIFAFALFIFNDYLSAKGHAVCDSCILTHICLDWIASGLWPATALNRGC